MNSISRNLPVALIAGVAGFLGSHLAESLLKKGVQVIGIDNLSSGSKEHLLDSSKDRHFHFINSNLESAQLGDLPRLDYAFFLLNPESSTYTPALERFINLLSKSSFKDKPKVVIGSTIELYNGHYTGKLKEAEKRLAKAATEDKLNIRVLRLASIYGPRMTFKIDDPLIELLQDWSQGADANLPSLDFSSRALYVDDAINLLIKAVLHGATAHKIFDGGLLYPIKLGEMAQVLKDPLWHEKTRFHPTLLPAWPTPNLIKTQKELAWYPKTSMVEGLKKTVAYLTEHPVKSQNPLQALITNPPVITPFNKIIEEPIKAGEREVKKPKVSLNWKQVRNSFWQITILGVILYALLWPLGGLIIGGLTIRYHLSQSNQALERGEFDNALNLARQAHQEVGEVNLFLDSLKPLRASGAFLDQFRQADQLIQALDKLTEAYVFNADGLKNLTDSIRVSTGDLTGDLALKASLASSDFNQAEADLDLSGAILNQSYWGSLPTFIMSRVDDLRGRIKDAGSQVDNESALAFLLPKLLDPGQKSQYLVALVDDSLRRTGGGEVTSLEVLKFDHGKLTILPAISPKDVDSKTSDSVAVPDELKNDFQSSQLNIKDTFLSPDYPTNARLLQFLYRKYDPSPEGVSGIIAINKTTAQNLLKTSGQTDSTDPMVIESAMLNRLFFAPGTGWLDTGKILSQAVLDKSLRVYLSDPQLFSFVNSKGWTNIVPRKVKLDSGQNDSIFGLFDSLISPNISPPQKEIHLTATILADNKINYKATVVYTNNNSTSVKYRVKLYLPSGVTMQKALWGEPDITNKLQTFADFGRAGYTTVLELGPREQRQLILEYTDNNLSFNGNQAQLNWTVLKQSGADDSTKMTVEVNLPASLTFQGGSKTIKYSTELSQDRSFNLNFTKVSP